MRMMDGLCRGVFTYFFIQNKIRKIISDLQVCLCIIFLLSVKLINRQIVPVGVKAHALYKEHIYLGTEGYLLFDLSAYRPVDEKPEFYLQTCWISSNQAENMWITMDDFQLSLHRSAEGVHLEDGLYNRKKSLPPAENCLPFYFPEKRLH